VHARPRASDVVTHQRNDDDGADQLKEVNRVLDMMNECNIPARREGP
jgi:hypothetical protein